MARIDNHQLPNLSLARKLFASFSLVLGLVLFFSAWFVSLILTTWDPSPKTLVMLGEVLMVVHEQSRRTFFGLLAVHAASVPIILAISRGLFDRVALSRGFRYALLAAPAFFVCLDLLCWALLPVSPVARAVLGPLLVLESLTLLVVMALPLKEMWIYRRWRGTGGRKHRVVVVGGGFGGLYTALGLDKALGYHKNLEIVLIDRKNYFLFPPLLPSVATGAIETRQVTNPFRRIFDATNIVFRKENVERVDLAGKCLYTRVAVDKDPDSQAVVQSESKISYDYLVLAPGSETNTFNTEGVESHAFFMREIGDAVSVRNHIIDCFELAARETNPSIQRELLRFIIVGAGPTGVELATEIQDLIHQVLLRRYPEVDHNFVEVFLVQSGPQVLPGWGDYSVKETEVQLKRLSIKLLLNVRVVKVGARSITLNTGEVIQARTCVWCAGVRPSPLIDACGFTLHRSGRVPVQPDLRVTGHDNVFVLGDVAYLEEGSSKRPLPPLAQVAFQQGKQTAGNLVRLLRGQATRPFKYFNYGALVSVGEHHAVIDVMGVRLSGFAAWMIWRALYLGKLVGMSNRLRVLMDWTLDLLVERSISQIWTSRREVQVRGEAEQGAAGAIEVPMVAANVTAPQNQARA